MSKFWEETPFIHPNSPEGVELQWQHFQGFTERCLDASRNKWEQKEKGRAAHAADQTLARAIIHGSPDDAVETNESRTD